MISGPSIMGVDWGPRPVKCLQLVVITRYIAVRSTGHCLLEGA